MGCRDRRPPRGALRADAACRRVLARARRGRLVDTSSPSGVCGNVGQANYGAGQAAPRHPLTALELTIAELAASAGRELGPGPWVRVDQREIDLFADATGDHQWIHVDREAAAAGPFGGTIAHGYLTLAMLPALLDGILTVTDARMGVNYGINRVRFTGPVPSGAEVRLRARLGSSEPRREGFLYRIEVEVEIRGAEKPALVGEVLFLVYP